MSKKANTANRIVGRAHLRCRARLRVKKSRRRETRGVGHRGRGRREVRDVAREQLIRVHRQAYLPRYFRRRLPLAPAPDAAGRLRLALFRPSPRATLRGRGRHREVGTPPPAVGTVSHAWGLPHPLTHWRPASLTQHRTRPSFQEFGTPSNSADTALPQRQTQRETRQKFQSLKWTFRSACQLSAKS